MLPAFLISWSLFWFTYFMKSQWELFMQNINVLIPLLVKRTEINLNIKKKKLSTINVRLIKNSPLTFRTVRFDDDVVILWGQEKIRWSCDEVLCNLYILHNIPCSFATSFPLPRTWSIISVCNIASLHYCQTTAESWILWQFSLLGQLCTCS